MEFWLIAVGAIIFGAVVWAAIKGIQDGEEAQEKSKELSEKYDLEDIYFSIWDKSFLGINFDRSIIVIGNQNQESTISFSSIIEFEVLLDQTSITKSNRGSQLAGAAIGGIALGGIGAIIGGLSGSTRTKNTVSEIALKLIVEDRFTPVHKVLFFKAATDQGAAPDSPLVKSSIEKVERFSAHLAHAFRKTNNKNEPKEHQKVDEIRSHSDETDAPLKKIPSSYSVILQSTNGKDIKVIDALKNSGHFDIQSALNVVKNAPSVVGENLSAAQAQQLANAIRLGGGMYEIKADE